VSDQTISEQEMIAAADKVELKGDPLTKAWWRELMRIRALTDLEPWEELLIELTIELESTMKKTAKGRKRDRYDYFLLEQLQLLVLPNPDNPQGDREKALAMVGIRADGKPMRQSAVAHMNLGEPLNTATRTLFRKHINRMSLEARNPTLDVDRWHTRIMVVLLTSALEGCDVNVLAHATGGCPLIRRK